MPTLLLQDEQRMGLLRRFLLRLRRRKDRLSRNHNRCADANCPAQELAERMSGKGRP